MQIPSTIKLLASTKNASGDLFTRLVNDLFFALGYDDLRLNVHKSGREVDIHGTHRLEPRFMVAECKAHSDKIGGEDLNKFFGVLERERDKQNPTQVAGYFVSLSGFRETGKEQELETSQQKRVILIDGKKVIEELQRCRALVNLTEAIEKAGHCAEYAGLNEAVLDGVELFGHDMGYLWAVFYSEGKARTHFTLIHADGTPLAESVASLIIKADRSSKGSLHRLHYLVPSPPVPDREELRNAVSKRYCQWISEECGYIQLDGLPADTDLSAARMRLERLFVPLNIVTKAEKSGKKKYDKSESIESVGKFICSHQHAAILASPGGGKSTLLKRLAIAYAAPERRTEVDDNLPERDWIPLFLRCRELKHRAHRPILELLDDLSQHAGLSVDEAAAFHERLHERLCSGKALLLVDGLDEISDEGARHTFAQHLRTFVAMFPHVTLLVTSREAGFRHVAGVIASVCDQARLAPFSKDDVERLCERWHVEVVGDTDQVRSDARLLADTIWNNVRIRVLAENPLMLTTILVVRRCIGDLPSRRVELYHEAVRVLIRTWNTEGFAPMDLEETKAQLSYIACTMMAKGIQQIGQKALLKLLQQAKSELEAELQFIRISPEEFVRRIEYRSSLLMQTGHERIAGELQPVYEFRHLTFQEYLAARGFVEEQYPGRDGGQSLADLLEPHFDDERWSEVIPLAVVMAGRRAEATVTRLIRATEDYSGENSSPIMLSPPAALLMQCLLDEVQVTPATLRVALLHLGEQKSIGDSSDSSGLLRGKFGELFMQLVTDAYFGADKDWERYVYAQPIIASYLYLPDYKTEKPSDALIDSLVGVLKSGGRIEKVHAALASMLLAFYSQQRLLLGIENTTEDSRYQLLYESLLPLVYCDDPHLSMPATWALAWIGENGLWSPKPSQELLLFLYRIWRDAAPQQSRFAGWAFSVQKLLPRETFSFDLWGECDVFLQEIASKKDVDFIGALIVGWYRHEPWDDRTIADLIKESLVNRKSSYRHRELLVALGNAGKEVLATLDDKK
ncbi:NACHT domain-containing protein [Chlorobium ferrooxidans]|uniref:NTPase (NACHT family)-like n=1 Tax=Chlorobium ferrooxidans DSM 13031 TaxID=377431 RepID=Q0YS73_9CHLB|nr:NACHT domain-containing protein [Chlorobium ferrooxidans]EAT59117.1 NTPase (NACHT family)-like [Chlorobium ferrooxidans DSM 13031]